jgi:adenosyl cobinamide kinase/adenosyl cobinamide phosphate guanylyltransferase
VGRAVKDTAETIEAMTTVALQSGLTINVSKTKHMISRKEKGNEPEESEIYGQRCEKVEMFKYICSLVTNTNEVGTGINARIIAGNKCYHALGRLLKQILVTQSLKLCLYETIIRLMVLYGVESLTLINKMERFLMTWERKILRNMYILTVI